MAEYIERAALKRSIRHAQLNPVDKCLVCLLADEIPAADVEEVKHGQWLPQIVLGQKAWDCSECKTLGSPHWNWCPVCGAKMDGGKNDAAD